MIKWRLRLLESLIVKQPPVTTNILTVNKQKTQQMSFLSTLAHLCLALTFFCQCCAVVTGSQKLRCCPMCWRETCCSFDSSLSSRQHQLSNTSLKQLKKMLFSVIPVHFLGAFMSYFCRYGTFFLFLLIHKSVWRNNIFTLSAQACLWKTGKIISLICCTT